jgi:hypothetical protein
MTVDNIDIPESNLNVKKLYGAGVMKKWVQIIGMR